MQRYMINPEHGRMPVYSDGEIEYNKQFGWIEEIEVAELTKSDEPEEVETPEGAYEKKFGKKPHHRMTLETIIAALEK